MSVLSQVRRLLEDGKISDADYAYRCLKLWPEFFRKFPSHPDPDANLTSENEKCKISVHLPGFLYFAKKTLFVYYEINNDTILLSGIDCKIVAQTVKYYAHKKEFGSVSIFENIEQWKERLFESGVSPKCGSVYTYPLSYPEALRQQLSIELGLPIKCFSRISHDSIEEEVLGYMPNTRLLLVPVFTAIVDLYPYDIKKQENLFDLIEEAYNHSSSSCVTEFLKIDYELVILRDCKKLNRIQETPDIDFHRTKLPRYWFDELEGLDEREFDKNGTKMMNALAIERSWADNPTSDVRYLVSCMFPAGALFLRTSVEAQKTTSGGGIEYIYVNNEDDRGKVVFLSSCKIKLEK